MLGDLLLTDISGNQDSDVVLPTLSEANIARRPNGAPARLGQKLAIISCDLVIGWSGLLLAGTELLQDFKANYSTRTPAEHELIAHLDRYNLRYGHKLSAIGMLKVGRRQVFQFSLNGLGFSDPRFGMVRAAGSGARHLMDLLQSLHGHKEATGKTLNPLESAVGMSFSMLGYLLGLEISTASNFDHFFGGGYEIVTQVDGRWQKVDDFMSVYWWGEELPTGQIRLEGLPIRCIRSRYYDDILVMRTLNFPGGVSEDRHFIIPPEYRVASKHELASVGVPDFDGKWICHQFVIKRLNGLLRPRNSVTFNGDPATAKLRITWDGKEFSVILAPGYHSFLEGVLADDGP